MTPVERALRKAHPHGHPEFIGITMDEVALHSRKNHDYALGGPPLGNFERVGEILALYPGLDPSQPIVVAMTYLLKQLDAVLWGLSKRIQHKVEGLRPRLGDISVYAKIAMCMVKDEEKVTNQCFSTGSIETTEGTYTTHRSVPFKSMIGRVFLKRGKK